MSDRSVWEDHAGWWQDHFTDGADAEYVEQIVPLALSHLAGTRRVLDVGTGEGQLARAVAGAGAQVVGLDPARAQLRVALQRGDGPSYVRGEAGALPFPTGSFDGALACLVFEHIDDGRAAIAEVARVLCPGGRFVFFLNHPLLQTPGSGWIDDRILDEQYWRIGPYLTVDRTMEEVDNGVLIPFVHRPLSHYVNALLGEGLDLVRMEEPAPPPGFLARADEYQAASTIPRLLLLVSVRRAGGGRMEGS
jgi:SAM-dependent methyltransferase